MLACVVPTAVTNLSFPSVSEWINGEVDHIVEAFHGVGFSEGGCDEVYAEWAETFYVEFNS